MALITKVDSIKNSDYNQTIEYLTKKHEEITNKKGEIVKYEPVYDEEGILRERENYSISYLKGDGTYGDIKKWNMECHETNFKYQQNSTPEERKAHHYVISFPYEDYARGLTVENAQKAAEEYCRENFKGYQAIVCTHGDKIHKHGAGTGNIHCHIVIHSVRTESIEPQDWMEKADDGNIKPSQYLEGYKHTNGPKLRYHLMVKIDEWSKKNGFVLENYSDPGKRTAAQIRMEYMHDSVVSASLKAKNRKELESILEKEYNLKLAIRGQAIRIYHPELTKPKRIEHIGLTPYDLTPDLHHYYSMCPHNYDGVNEKWANPETRFNNEYESKNKIKTDEDDGIIIESEDSISRKNWTSSKTFRAYSVSRYNDNGEKRTLAESLMILAYVVIENEMPDFAKTGKQRQAENESQARANTRSNQVYKPKNEKLKNMQRAIQYAKELQIDTPAQAMKMSKDKLLTIEKRNKAKFVLNQLELAKDKEYCYAKISRNKQKQHKTNGYSKEAIENAKRQLIEIQKQKEKTNIKDER